MRSKFQSFMFLSPALLAAWITSATYAQCPDLGPKPTPSASLSIEPEGVPVITVTSANASVYAKHSNGFVKPLSLDWQTDGTGCPTTYVHPPMSLWPVLTTGDWEIFSDHPSLPKAVRFTPVSLAKKPVMQPERVEWDARRELWLHLDYQLTGPIETRYTAFFSTRLLDKNLNEIPDTYTQHSLFPLSRTGTASKVLENWWGYVPEGAVWVRYYFHPANREFVTGDVAIPPMPLSSNLQVGLDLDELRHPNGIRMLTAKYRTDDAYPQPNEQEPPLPQGGPRMRIRGSVWDAATNAPPAGTTTVYLRLLDPADSAPYTIKAGLARGGDNVDTSAELSSVDGAASVSACAETACAPGDLLAVTVPAGSGKFEAILTGSKYAAGDNYQIEAFTQLDLTCPSTGACAKTGVITMWKRVYVEVNKMARKGAMLTRAARPGAAEIEISDVRHFPAETPFRVRLLHAPPANSIGGQFYAEEHIVERVEGRRLFSGGKPEPGKLIFKQGETITQTFLGPETVGVGSDTPTRRLYLADAVMWYRNDRALDYFRPDLSRVAAVFEDAFVETVWLTDDAVADGAPPNAATIQHDGFLPLYEDLTKDNERDGFARKWTRTVVRHGLARRAEDNHQVLFSAWYRQGSKGATLVSDGFNETWLFEKNYEKAHPGKTLAHELAHQWRTNQGYSPVTGTTPPPGSPVDHCDDVFPATAPVQAYTGNEACLMFSNIGNVADGQKSSVLFHYVVSPSTGAVDSEYLWVRQRAEPVPQYEVQIRKRYFR